MSVYNLFLFLYFITYHWLHRKALNILNKWLKAGICASATFIGMQKWGGLWGRFELTLAVQSLSLFPGSGPAQSVVENREEMAGSAEGRMEPRYPVCSQLLTHDFFFFP